MKNATLYLFEDEDYFINYIKAFRNYKEFENPGKLFANNGYDEKIKKEVMERLRTHFLEERGKHLKKNQLIELSYAVLNLSSLAGSTIEKLSKERYAIEAIADVLYPLKNFLNLGGIRILSKTNSK